MRLAPACEDKKDEPGQLNIAASESILTGIVVGI